MDRLGVPDIARLLKVSRPRVWQLRKRPDFPAPAGTEGGRDYWYEASILRWAANAGRDLTDRAPVLFRPADSDRPSEYLGARIVNGHALFVWATAYGWVCLGYRRAYRDRPLPRQLLDLSPDIDTAVSVRPTWNAWGLEVQAVDREAPSRLYTPRWTDLERILGTPAPWWPSPLRKLDEMIRWKPGAEPRATAAVPDVDTIPLLRLATDAPDGSAVNVVLLDLARTIQARATEYARDDIERIAGAEDRDAIALGAIPAPARPEQDEPDEHLRRAAWAEVLSRTDTLAEECVSAAMYWNGGADFPFSGFHDVRPTDHDVVVEWEATLKPTPRTAAFAVFNDDRVAVTLVDTATDLPVAQDADGVYWVAVPQRLPARAGLAEIHLAEHHVWVRTADGGLYLAPERPGNGIAYGYGGSGPITLAALINRLLDDIGAPAPQPWEDLDPPAGLLAGTTGGWKAGDVLTRDDLLAARNAV